MIHGMFPERAWYRGNSLRVGSSGYEDFFRYCHFWHRLCIAGVFLVNCRCGTWARGYRGSVRVG